MKKGLSWKFLIPFAIAIALIRSVTQGVIPDFLGLLEAIVLVMGVIDLLRWLFKRSDKAANNIPPVTHHASQPSKSVSFAFIKNSSVAYTLIALVVSACLIFGVWEYINARQANWQCLQRIAYHAGSDSYYKLNGSDKISMFKTQNEAMQYCLAELSS